MLKKTKYTEINKGYNLQNHLQILKDLKQDFIFENSNPKGTSAILTYISLFGGLNLLFLGMCGSYIIKIYENLNKVKKYHISKIIKNNF